MERPPEILPIILNLMSLMVKMTGNDPAICVTKDLEMVCLLMAHGIPRNLLMSEKSCYNQNLMI